MFGLRVYPRVPCKRALTRPGGPGELLCGPGRSRQFSFGERSQNSMGFRIDARTIMSKNLDGFPPLTAVTLRPAHGEGRVRNRSGWRTAGQPEMPTDHVFKGLGKARITSDAPKRPINLPARVSATLEWLRRSHGSRVRDDGAGHPGLAPANELRDVLPRRRGRLRRRVMAH